MHRHTKAVCEIIRFRAEVVCVLCGSRCDLLGLKEPGDIETASLQRGLLRGVNFPDRLSVSHLCVCVCERWLCAPVSSFHFHHLSIPPVLLPPTLRPFLPSSSIPLFHRESYRSSRRPNQFSSESSPVSRGCGAQTSSLATLSHITQRALSHAHTTCIHSQNMH